MPWVYEFGMEAYRRASDGNPAEAREIFQELETLSGIANENYRLPAIRYIGELNGLLERFIEYNERRSFEVDDLPF